MALGGVLSLLVAGCTTASRPAESPVAIPPAFSSGGEIEPPDRWWTAFGEPELDRLVGDALAANLALETVWQRLREAQAVLDRAAAEQLPTVDGFLEGELRRPEDEEGEELRLGLTAGYELDLWGRIGSRVEAERLRARAGVADYQAAAVSLSAEVTRTWLQLVEARSQLDLLDEQIAADEHVLRLLEARFGSGQVRAVDVLRQRQLVEATREQRLVVEARRQVLGHLLAVLLGRPPQQTVETAVRRLPTLPPRPETGLPLDLLRRRPDVLTAELLLRAADHDLAAAVASRYPRLSLTATAAATGDGTSGLVEDWVRSLSASLLAPLYRGGELAAEVDRADAVRARRLTEYGQVVLTAFQEVEDALVREALQVDRMASLQEQVDLAEAAHRRLRMQYLNGLGSFIDVLAGRIEEQRLRRELIAARRVLLEHRVALYRALAGGFPTGRQQQDAENLATGTPPAGGDRRGAE